jgi:protein-S-isoprenylcysteine O-methyltransferase Ste14
MKDEPWWKGTRGEWYVVAQLFLMALVVFGPRTLPGLPARLLPDGGSGDSIPFGRIFAGFFLFGLGALLVVVGILSLGPNLTIVPRPKDDAELVQGGVYRIVRHPIYGGVILGSLGWTILYNGPLTLVYALLLAIVLDVKSRREERWLNEKYPDYGAYRQRVRKLIPFVY